MPPKGVLGLGLDRAGKALAGDWGLLKAELSEVGNPGLCEVAVPPRFKDPIPARGSIWRRAGEESAPTLQPASVKAKHRGVPGHYLYGRYGVQTAGAGGASFRHDPWRWLPGLVHHVAAVGHHGEDGLRQLLRHAPTRGTTEQP